MKASPTDPNYPTQYSRPSAVRPNNPSSTIVRRKIAASRNIVHSSNTAFTSASL